MPAQPEAKSKKQKAKSKKQKAKSKKQKAKSKKRKTRNGDCVADKPKAKNQNHMHRVRQNTHCGGARRAPTLR
ncbi:hypothetical protein V4C53_37325 [Paraburkholderia azotifigens]|uniref:hypothetical protein n=1 Tax=Paraburkholderia azotifigens TaxID=2057004 RepID=UPI00317EF050